MKDKFPYFISSLLLIFLLLGLATSLPPAFTTPRTCADTWGTSCDGGGLGTTDDAFFNLTGGDCPGAENNAPAQQHNVKDVSVNASAVLFGDSLEASCSFMAGNWGGDQDQLYMWYYNGTDWMTLGSWVTSEPMDTTSEYNRSVVFQVSSIEGEHIIRCAFCNKNTVSDYCADQKGETCFATYDNDDVNFTVTIPLTYDSWNLNVSDYSNLKKSDSVKAFAHWNKNLSSAEITHNGTGSFQNYTISDFTGNWTNYTLDLSNTAEFSEPGLIKVSHIWAEDNYGLENTTSPSHYFYLWRESKLYEIDINDTVVYNETTVRIRCRVRDYHTNQDIENYNVSLYKNDTYVGKAATNVFGWAYFYKTVKATEFPQDFEYKCNITDDLNKYYNASSENSKIETVTVVDLGIKASADPSIVDMGNSVEIIANITGNASSIQSVQANISYTDVSGDQYVQVYEIQSLSLDQSYSSTKHKYHLNYDPPRPSNYFVNITVQVGKEKWDTTSFTVWGDSRVSQIQLSDSIIYNATTVQIDCTVRDVDTDDPILGYDTFFYRDDNYIGNSTTDSNGIASLEYYVTTDSIPKNLNMKCNITDNSTLYYNASSENSKNTTLQVYELGINAFSIPPSVNYGDTVWIIANITGNASKITSVLLNVTFMNISNGKIVQTYENGPMSYIKSYSPTKHEYRKIGTPSTSGDYDVNITVYAQRVKSNTTSFNVSFGIPTITFVYPNYRVMVNQTFNLTTNISSSSGDIWYTNLAIDITNENVMNVTPDQSFSLSTLYNVSNGSTIVAKWTLKSKEEGLSGVTLNATPQNGSSDSDFTSHSIIHPILETTSPINVSDNENITVKIVGNLTGISTINFSVFIPYINEIINDSAVYVGNQTEAFCTGEPLSSGRYTLGKDSGGNATCTGEDCNNTIDNITSSFMNVGKDSGNYELIIKLESEETIERIVLLWMNISGGTSIIYYNSSGNWVTNPTISNLSPPTTKDSTTLTGFTPFKTNAFKMNNTENFVKLYEFEAYGTLGKVSLCYIYKYNFTDTTKSGTYLFNTTTKTKNAIVTQPSSFFANFGYPLIEIKNETYFKGATNNYSTTITASNGDLRNLTLNLTIYNISVVQNSTPSETLLKNVSEILSGNSDEVKWNLLAMDDGITNAFITVNSTTNKGNYNQSENFTIDVISEAGNPPEVANFWFSYQGTNTNKTNLYTSFKIHANVSDDVKIDNVLVNLTYPGGYNVNLSMTGPSTFGWYTWEYTFETSNYPLNETGNYTVGIIAIDLGGQENVSGTYDNYPAYLTFFVNDTYTLVLASGYSLYMRGENVTIQANDVNDKVAENVNWDVNTTKINETYNYSSQATTYTHTILNDDPEGNYSIFAINATKYGNYGNGTWYFNVSRNFSIDVTVNPSASRDAVLIIDSDLYNARGNLHSLSVYGNITCQNRSEVYLTYPLTFDNNGHADFDGTCWTPEGYSAKYYITINVSDQYNNYGFYNNTFTTEAQTTPPTTIPSGGGGGGTPEPTCVPEATFEMYCNDGLDNDCDGATDCADPDCFDFSACIKRIPNFNFTLSLSEIEITRGENGTVMGSMSNLGNTKLNLVSKVDVEKACCLVELPSIFVLPVKASSDFLMFIHVNTSTLPGEYIIDLKIRYPPLENSRSVKVIVKENSYIWFIFEDVPDQIPILLSEIKEYQDLGIDVDHLEDKIKSIQSIIENARIAVQEDNLELLKNYSDDIDRDVEYINSEKERLSFRKIMYANKWTITYGLIIGLVSAYLAIQIFAPFFKLSQEIVKLTFEKNALVQSRKEAEKQYFLRRIDEQTFRRIVEQKHSQALKLSSTINLKKQQRRNLIRKRLNPLYIGELIKSKLTKKKS